jgi:three-Cys-motif partner protein
MSRYGSEGEDIIGVWSEDKLALLAKYLKAYSVIMNDQKKSWLREYYYIDAFAGSVRPRAKEDEQRYIDGSPLRALQTEPKFDAYFFIDVSSRRIERIEKLREDFPKSRIEIREGNCNQILRDDIIPQIPYSSKKASICIFRPLWITS